MTSLNQNQIKEYIPHREPFLFIDELIDIEKLKKATGIKTFRENDYFLKVIFLNSQLFQALF